MNESKESNFLAGLGFYGAMIAFVYFAQDYAKTVFLIWAGISVFCWLRLKKDADFLDKLPPFIQAVVVFASGTFFVTCIFIALGLVLYILGFGRR
jgi:hypothetical protein